METPNPYASPADTETSQESPAETIFGPIALLVLLASVGLTVYLFSVRGPVIFTDPKLRWESLKRLGSPFGFYLACCVWGIIAGLLVCVPLHVLRRVARKRTPKSPIADDLH